MTFHRKSYFSYKSAGVRQSPYVDGNGGRTQCPPYEFMRLRTNSCRGALCASEQAFAYREHHPNTSSRRA